MNSSIEKTVAVLSTANIEVLLNENLKKHTSFKIGGNAKLFCVAKNEEDLKLIFNTANENALDVMILGRGTNVLFSDDGYNGIIVKLGEEFCTIDIKGNCIFAGAGASLKDVCIKALDASLDGLSFAYGIPGGLGGAIYMNAGAFGGEMKNIVSTVKYMYKNGDTVTIGKDGLDFSYRKSVFQKTDGCILAVEMELAPGNYEKIKNEMDDFWHRREEKQPIDMPSAGSAFKRPEGAFAAELIDRCGLRGFSIGGAAISEKHTGFIVNKNNATCHDVLTLADTVSEIVKEKTGFLLEKEIMVINNMEACKSK